MVSFDPPNGHLWMIKQGSRLFNELIVGVGTNASKKSTFSCEQRLSCQCNRFISKCNDQTFFGRLLVDFASQHNASFLLRGVRGVSDWPYEQSMRNINSDLRSDIETVIMMPPRELCDISSSIVRGLVGQSGWEEAVKRYVLQRHGR